MKWTLAFALLLAVSLFGAPASADHFKGTVLFSDGRLDYATVSLGDTHSDAYLSYYRGSVPGYRGTLLYDPYNRIWVAGPIRYRPATFYFDGRKIRGRVREFGDGTKDSRFFFGDNGHVYQRVDYYRSYDSHSQKGKGSKGKGRGKDRGRGHDKVKAYSFWVDLSERRFGDPVYVAYGEERPSRRDLQNCARELWAYDYGNWHDFHPVRPVNLDPLPDEDRLSLGFSISFKL